MKYQEFIKHTNEEGYNPKPIRLEIGKRRKYYGIEVKAKLENYLPSKKEFEMYEDLNGYLVTYGDVVNIRAMEMADTLEYLYWLHIKCNNDDDIKYLDEHWFRGVNFSIFAGNHGDDFISLEKRILPGKNYKNPKANIVYL